MALPSSGGLTLQQLAAINKLAIAHGTMNIATMRPQGDAIWLRGVSQIEDCVFILGRETEAEVWEWLINSPYQVKMENRVRVEFLDPAGAVAFKLMFVKEPRVDYPGNKST